MTMREANLHEWALVWAIVAILAGSVLAFTDWTVAAVPACFAFLVASGFEVSAIGELEMSEALRRWDEAELNCPDAG